MSIGGRLGYEDDGETPNTQIVYHDYEDAPLIFETRGLPKDKAAQGDGWGENMNSPEEFPDEKGIGVVVQCEGGRVFCDAGGKVKITDNDGKESHKVEPKGDKEDIFENFMAAVRSRKVEDQTADCEKTHLSSALCHTGLISHRLGEPMHDGEVKERIESDKLLTSRFEAMADHLQKNGVDLDSETIVLGAALKFNPGLRTLRRQRRSRRKSQCARHPRLPQTLRRPPGLSPVGATPGRAPPHDLRSDPPPDALPLGTPPGSML